MGCVPLSLKLKLGVSGIHPCVHVVLFSRMMLYKPVCIEHSLSRDGPNFYQIYLQKCVCQVSLQLHASAKLAISDPFQLINVFIFSHFSSASPCSQHDLIQSVRHREEHSQWWWGGWRGSQYVGHHRDDTTEHRVSQQSGEQCGGEGGKSCRFSLLNHSFFFPFGYENIKTASHLEPSTVVSKYTLETVSPRILSRRCLMFWNKFLLFWTYE